MTEYAATYLPHIGVAIILIVLVLAIAKRLTASTLVLGTLSGLTATATLVPFADYSLSHYLRPLTGDLSIASLACFSLLIYTYLKKQDMPFDTPILTLIVACSALILYPTSLGLTYFDLYAYGYYPIILAPCVFVVFATALWNGWRLTACVIPLAYIAFTLGLLESDNLWDYLLDPMLTIFAVTVLLKNKLPLRKPSQQQMEFTVAVTLAIFLSFAVVLSRLNPEAFRFVFVVEDGFIEWCTVLVLLTAMVVCGKRFLALRSTRGAFFLTVTGLLTLFCLFGAGEEISWGQRIFGLETPEYLKDINAQGELGLHNLKIEINGETVKLNKLIFGTGLALALTIYLFIATPLYRRNERVKRFFDGIAAPMPRNYHIIGYLLILAVVELLIDSSKRGEMTEVAGAAMFTMNIIFPYNAYIFDPNSNVASPISNA